MVRLCFASRSLPPEKCQRREHSRLDQDSEDSLVDRNKPESDTACNSTAENKSVSTQYHTCMGYISKRPLAALVGQTSSHQYLSVHTRHHIMLGPLMFIAVSPCSATFVTSVCHLHTVCDKYPIQSKMGSLPTFGYIYLRCLK